MKFTIGSLLLLVWLPAVSGELQVLSNHAAPPDFELEDLAGQTHRLSDYRGQVVLINFWATWCPPCLAEMPSMQRLADSQQDQPFAILAINVEQSKSTVWKFLGLLDIEFTALLDSTGATAKSWDIELYPTSYLIDAEGEARYRVRGAVQWDGMEVTRHIEALLPAAEGRRAGAENYSSP